MLEDKIVQQATRTVLEWIYEEDFLGFSYGFRPGRSCHRALDALYVGIGKRKVNWIIDADIRGFFDNIDHAWLMKFLEHRIADRRVLRLVKRWLRAGVSEDGQWSPTKVGTPQGAVISPLLANVFLHYVLDLWIEAWRKRHAVGEVIIVRYADDFVLGFREEADARRCLEALRERLAHFGLELHPEKTRLVELGLGREGFDFLGCHLRIVRSHFKGKRYLFRWPSRRAMNAIREKIRFLTDRRRRCGFKDIREVILELNPVLRGWGNYFRTGNASAKFNAIDAYVRMRLVRLLARKGGNRRWRPNGRPFRAREWPHVRFVAQHGLYKLLGTIRYPGGAHAV